MANEPLDQFFTNFYIYNQMKQRKKDDEEMRKLESKVRTDNG